MKKVEIIIAPTDKHYCSKLIKPQLGIHACFDKGTKYYILEYFNDVFVICLFS